MEEEKEVSVEKEMKEMKERANRIASELVNDNNLITIRGQVFYFVPKVDWHCQ